MAPLFSISVDYFTAINIAQSPSAQVCSDQDIIHVEHLRASILIMDYNNLSEKTEILKKVLPYLYIMAYDSASEGLTTVIKSSVWIRNCFSASGSGSGILGQCRSKKL
jgi:hypothetical protein